MVTLRWDHRTAYHYRSRSTALEGPHPGTDGNLPRAKKQSTGLFFTSLRSVALFDPRTVHT